MRVLDPKTNQILDLNSGAIADPSSAIASGQLIPSSNDTYNIKDLSGNVSQVNGNDLLKSLAGGASVYTAPEAAMDAEKVKYGGIGGQTAAGALGLANGLTLGGTGALLSKTGLVDAETQDALNRQNPVTAIGSNIAGAILPVVLSGGAAAPEEGAGILARMASMSPAGLVGRAGAAATEAAAPLIEGVASNVASPLAQKVIEGAAKLGTTGAVEGAFYGGSGQISEDLIHNKPLAAEGILASAGLGSLLGGTIGSAFGAAEPIASKGVDLFAKKLNNVLGVLDNPETQTKCILRDLGTTQKNAREVLGSDFKTQNITDVMKMAYNAPEEINAGSTILKAAEEHTKDVGLNALTHSPEQLLENVQKIKNSAGEAGAEILENTPGEVKVKDIADHLRAQAEDLKTSLTDPGHIKRIEDFAQRVESKFAGLGDDPVLSLRDAQKLKTEINDQIYKESLTAIGTRVDNPLTEALAKTNKEIDSKIISKLEETSPEKAADYIKTKNLYAGASDSEKLLNHKIGKSMNNIFGPTDYATGIGGAAIGGAPGAAIGFIGRKVARDYGDRAALIALSNIEKSGAKIGKISGEAIKGMMEPTRKVISVGIIKSSPHAEKVEKLAMPPEQIQNARDQLNRSLGAIAIHAPQTALALHTKAMNALDFLQSKIPLPPQSTPLVKYEPPQSEIEKFNRYYNAVEDPKSILNSIKKGYVSPEEVEVLKSVYPEIHNELKDQITEKLSENTKDNTLPFQQRIQLQKILDVKADASLVPKNIKALQQTFGGVDPAQAQQQPSRSPSARIPGARAKSLNLGSSLSSGFESTLRRRN